MVYSGDPFCVSDATDGNKWTIFSFAVTARIADKTVKVKCTWMETWCQKELKHRRFINLQDQEFANNAYQYLKIENI